MPRPRARVAPCADGALRVRHARRLRLAHPTALSRPGLRPLRRHALPQLRPLQGSADRGRAPPRAAHDHREARALGQVAGRDDRHPPRPRRDGRAPRHLRQPFDGADPDGQHEHPHRPDLVEASEPCLLDRAGAASSPRHPLRGPPADRSRRDQPQSLRSHGPRDAAPARRALPPAHRRRSRQREVSRRARGRRRRGARLVADAPAREWPALVGGAGPALVSAWPHRQVEDALARLRRRRTIGHRLLLRRHRLRRVLPAHPRPLSAPSPGDSSHRPRTAAARDGSSPHLRRRRRSRRPDPRRGDIAGGAFRHLPAGGRRRGGARGLAPCRARRRRLLRPALLGTSQRRGAAGPPFRQRRQPAGARLPNVGRGCPPASGAAPPRPPRRASTAASARR
jgi:hypothetical protein